MNIDLENQFYSLLESVKSSEEKDFYRALFDSIKLSLNDSYPVPEIMIDFNNETLHFYWEKASANIDLEIDYPGSFEWSIIKKQNSSFQEEFGEVKNFSTNKMKEITKKINRLQLDENFSNIASLNSISNNDYVQRINQQETYLINDIQFKLIAV